MTHLAYQPRENWLYQLHPVSKGLATICFILVFSLHPHGLSLTLLFFGALLLFTHDKFQLLEAVQALKSLWLLLLLVGVTNFFAEGKDSLLAASDAILRICGIFLVSAIFVSITSQSELTVFWETFFWPLSSIGISSRELALVMTISVRFFPVILNEIDRIRIAQSARGARWGAEESFFLKPFQLMPLFLPVLISSFRRAANLSLAMEARGYRLSGPRSRHAVFSFKRNDFLVGIFLVLNVFYLMFPMKSLIGFQFLF